MKLKALIKPLVPKSILDSYRRRPKYEGIGKYKFDENSDARQDILSKYGAGGVLVDLFASHQEFVVHKWHHYIPLYERYFASFRGRPTRFLEIGVSKGGSLQMWRQYFGPEATIFGIDIDAECAKFNGLAGQVRIGSQADTQFLESVVKEMGGVDVVLDDGSHHMEHIPASLKCLFPHLSHGGIYMIEDLHTAYWESFGGGYGEKGNFFGSLMGLVDDIHHWYHAKGLRQAAISQDCSGIHIHDSIVVLEKNKVYPPVHSQNGRLIS